MDMDELLQADELADPRPEGHPQSMYGYDDKGEEINVELDELADHISKQWYENRRDRTRIEYEMLAMQEASNSMYDASMKSAIRAQGGSEIFIPLTSMQCNAASSWLLSVLTPPGDKAFSFKASPVPELSKAQKLQIGADVKEGMKKSMPQGPDGVPQGPDGQPVQPAQVTEVAEKEGEELKEEFKKESKKRAEKMEGLVYDQLLNSGWYQTLEDFVTDLTVLPTAFIKTTYEWKKSMVVTTIDGAMTMEAETKLVAKDERVSAFDIYPSPDQTTVHDGSMIERLKLSRMSIYDCLDKPGYDNDNIMSVLEDFDSNSTNFASWQSNIDSTRRYAENHSIDFSGQDGSIYGLRFLGPVAISKLLDWGYSVDSLIAQSFLSEEDALDEERLKVKEIDVDAILIGSYVIKVAPNMDPEGKRPFYSASYRKVPGSFWGKSVAMLAKAHQRMVNACARALSNNMGIASGPQIVVYTDRLPNGESVQQITPLKIWQMTSDPSGSNSVPIQFFQPKSNAQELMSVYQYYTDSVGDVTGIPKQSYSSDPSRQQQGAQTASGMAMQIESASKQIKQAVRNIDTGVIEPRLSYQYRTNMMNPEIDNSYKGDMQPHATGAKSIVAKAVNQQRSIELLQSTANPMDQEVLGKEGRAALLRGIIADYDMTDIIPSEEEMAKKAKEEAQQPKPPSPEETKLQIEQIRAKVRIEDQKLENSNAEAQRKLDMQIAQMELQAKQMDIQVAQIQNKAQGDQKMKEIALKESNANSRFQTEVALKQAGGTGV